MRGRVCAGVLADAAGAAAGVDRAAAVAGPAGSRSSARGAQAVSVSASAAAAQRFITVMLRRELAFEGFDGLGEHPLVSRRPRRGEIGLGAGERQRDRLAPRLCVALFRRQSTAEVALAFLLRLLVLDILTLEAACHKVF